MPRPCAVLVLLAVALAGCGAGGQQEAGPSTVTASPAMAPDAGARCEHSADRIRREHPEAYVAPCNQGTATLENAGGTATP